MRNLVLVSASVVALSLGAAFSIGCSSAPSEEASGEKEEKDEGSLTNKGSKESAAPAATSTSSTEPAPTTDYGDAGATWGDQDASAALPTTPADLSLCKTGSTQEVESNDSAATANAMPGQTFSFCGSLSSATDVDFVTFTLPADTKSFAYGVSFNRNGIDASITAGAQGPFRLNQTVPILPGQKYVVRVAGAQAMGYRVDVSIGR